MPFMVWNDKLSVSVDILDEDHKRLVEMMNELYDAIQNGHSKDVAINIFDRLTDYTHYHFAHEEALFARTGYPEAARHKQEHDAMVARVDDLRERLHDGMVPSLSLEVMNDLKDWLFDHEMTWDRRYAPYLNAAGVH
jgi:hemerythrin